MTSSVKEKSVRDSVFRRDRYNADEFTKCYVFRSIDGVNWKREVGPFPYSEGVMRAEAEKRRVQEYEEATRQSDGSYETYTFLIRCYTPDEDPPISLSTLHD